MIEHHSKKKFAVTVLERQFKKRKNKNIPKEWHFRYFHAKSGAVTLINKH